MFAQCWKNYALRWAHLQIQRAHMQQVDMQQRLQQIELAAHKPDGERNDDIQSRT
jgi:hypothetical protein